MKMLSQMAKCDQSDPGGHISENPPPYTPPLQIVSTISKEKKKERKNFSGVF